MSIMCGIVGFNWEDKELVREMAFRLAHRGPDQCGIYTDSSVSLGHCRLSIIDLSERGRQPMSNETGTIWIVFNGEIYNYQSLKEELEAKGHRFQSNTDTETIVHAYEEYGQRCVERLNGMFAFAIWDSTKKTLFLARDRLGVKPLYYHFNNGNMVFASEIKSILAHEIERKVDVNALNSYIAFKFVPGPATGFVGISKLQPGHCAELYHGRLKIFRYWDLNFREEPMSKEHCIEMASKLLEDSVRMRLMADVPLGVFLSGGLDSSIITALMSRFQDNVKTFSLGFEEDGHNELKYAQQVADMYHTDHQEVITNFDKVRDLLPKIAYHLDEPMSDWAAIPTYMVSKLARSKVKVALAGDGGDELFVGYRQSIMNHYSPLLRPVPGFAYSWLPKSNKVRKACEISGQGTDIECALSWIKVFQDWERKDILTPSAFSKELDAYKAYGQKIEGLSGLNKNLYVEAKTWLPDDLLMKIDKTSMMVSLEARVPFLDYRLVEFMCKVPTSLKLHGTQTKHLLKTIARPMLPPELIDRKKHGFTLPTTEWFRGELRGYVSEVLSDPQIYKYIDKYAVDRCLELHARGREDFGFKICNLVSFALWHKIHIEGEKPKALKV